MTRSTLPLPTLPLATRMVDTAAGRVRASVTAAGSPSGEVKPPFVFVHGYPDNLQIWARLVPQLARRCPDRDVIAFDWPGLGHSEAIGGGATPFHLGRHFIALLDALDVETAIPVGFDMGGHVIVAAATSAGDRIDRLVLTNFLADGTVPTSWDIDVMRRLGLNRLVLRYGPRVVFARAQATFLKGRCDLDEAIRTDMWTGFNQPETRDRLRKMCAGYEASLRRVAALYPQIEHETLVLWADRDPHFPIAQAHALDAALPNGRLAVLTGASHWFMWDEPAAVVNALAAFISPADGANG